MTEVMRLKREYDRKNPDLIQDVLDPAVMQERREAKRREQARRELEMIHAENRRKEAAIRAKSEARLAAKQNYRRKQDSVEAVARALAAMAA